MMKKIIGVIGAAVVAVIALAAPAAHATCTTTIYADRAYSSGTTTYIYGDPTGVSVYYYYGYTTNATLANLFFAAVANRTRVLVSGNTTSCPTNSTGARYLGQITYAYISP